MANTETGARESEAAFDGADRFGWLERPHDDFPYYNGRPAGISGPQWLLVMAAVAIGFLALVTPAPFLGGGAGFVRPILFCAVPLAALAVVAGHHWTAIFRRIRARDFGWMIGFAVLNMLVSMGVGALVLKTLGASANPSLAGLGDLAVSERVLFYLRTAPQLFGEEVMTILPFLALLTLFSARMRCSRRSSIVAAWLLSALLFGLVHLPTYDWNLVQCVVVIGSARLILTLPYIMTKSIWVSTGAHVLNDWIFFTVTILGADLRGV